MKFLTGKPFPSFEEWCLDTSLHNGLTMVAYPDSPIYLDYYKELTEFREGCMREVIALLDPSKDPTDEGFKHFERWLDSEPDDLQWEHYVAGLLEASLSEQNKEVENNGN